MDVFEVIRLILASPVGSFGFGFGMVVLGGGLIYYITKEVTKIKTEHGETIRTLDKVSDSIDVVKQEILYLKADIYSMKIRMEIPDSDIAQSHSPIALTEKGKDLCAKMKAELYVAGNWERISANIDGSVKGRNAYDIQQYCIDTAAVFPERFFRKEDIDAMKLFAFQVGRSYPQLSIIPAILIRDRYFKENSIDVGDVDLHSPAPSPGTSKQ